MIGLKRGTVQLLYHDTKWDSFATETISRLKGIFGKAAVDIQHVGSTAVKSIKAKPIIDIAVGVKDLNYAKRFIPLMERNGYMYKDIGRDRELFFSSGDFENDIRNCHIHVVEVRGKEWADYITFRDYLNDNINVAKEYETLKLDLCEKYSEDRESYTAGKSEFIRKTLREARATHFLGRIVDIVIDRPLGSVHPDHEDIVYPVNYGYIPNTVGGDGEEVDVYLVGLDHPVSKYTCRIIGAILRTDDSEDKLVGAPIGKKFHQAQISKFVEFQEKYFKSKIIPIYHRSCGTVVFRNNNGNIEFLLLFQNGAGTWSFPKGHMESGETEVETACRETREEIGMDVKVFPQYRREVHYPVAKNARKTVVLYLAESNGEPEIIRPNEIVGFRWADINEAKTLLHSDYSRILDEFYKNIKEVMSER